MSDKGFLNRLWSSFAEASPQAVAFTAYNGKTFSDISYPQFARDILKTVAHLQELGIKGQHIALMAPEDYRFFVMFFAAVLSGNAAVILNPALPNEMLQWQCKKADVSAAYAPATLIGELGDSLPGMRWLACETVREWEAREDTQIACVADDRTVLMMFTSGTTGQSKVVEMTGRNLEACAVSANCMYETPGMEIALHAIPRYHIGGFRSAMVCFNRLETVYIGRGIRYLFMDIPVFNPKCIVVVPAMLDNLVKLLQKARTDAQRERILGTRLRRVCVGGAAVKPQTALFLMDLGIDVDVIYGMTETACIATWCLLDREHLRTVGKPFGGMECKISDGEILVRGPAVMKGYYHDPEETAKVLEGEWIRTGDMGYCDESGFFYLTGRKKNVIILSNGENVNPEEIEAALGAWGSILECMVYGDGKGICADIYTQDRDTAMQDVKAYNENTPTYRQVYKVNYSDEPLPRTGSGKIKRKENVYEQG